MGPDYIYVFELARALSAAYSTFESKISGSEIRGYSWRAVSGVSF